MSKYVQTTTIACKYSPEFRGLVYKIDPHDISCMYKRMFEMCATNTLREFDFKDDDNKRADINLNYVNKEADNKPTFIGDNQGICGWQVCENSHASQTMGSARTSSAGGCRQTHVSPFQTRSHSAFAKLENYSVRDDRTRITTAKLTNSCRKTISTETVFSRQSECRLHSPRLNGSSQIPFDFQHGQAYSHIGHYREQYTYKRMKLFRSNVNDYNRSCPAILTAPPPVLNSQRPATMPPSRISLYSSSISTPVLRCFDVFGSVKNVPVTSTNAKQTPKRHIRKTVQKTKSQPSPELPEKDHPIRKMDMGVNLQQLLGASPGSGITRTGKKSGIMSSSIRIPLINRSRPTFPNDIRRGSTEPTSYVVTYQKK